MSSAVDAAVRAERDRLADALLHPSQDAADRIGHLSITCCPLSIGDRGRALLAGVAQMIGLTDPRDPPEGKS